MILIDTNTVSEVFKQSPNRNVERWFRAQPESALFICTPVIAELHFGVRLLPEGKRKRELSRFVEDVETNYFADRVLILDIAAAQHFGEIRATRQIAGTPIMPMDALIAAIARANSMTLATRNTRDFEGLGITLVNPFEAKVR
jgi:predicted nucleic acid-binding protein